jgi:hypothetical protein
MPTTQTQAPERRVAAADRCTPRRSRGTLKDSRRRPEPRGTSAELQRSQHCSKRLSSLAEDGQIGVICEQSIAPPARDLTRDIQTNQDFDHPPGNGESRAAGIPALDTGERSPAQD